jgi:hypothetical protein
MRPFQQQCYKFGNNDNVQCTISLGFVVSLRVDNGLMFNSKAIRLVVEAYRYMIAVDSL